MGNLYAESALNPMNLQNSYEKKLGMTNESYTAAVDDGSYSNFVKDSAGYGLAQWTYWSRKQNLLNFAKEAGASIGDLNMQLDFLMKELGSYSSVLKALKEAVSVREASDVVLTKYEKPADQSDAAKAKRASYGQKYYDEYAATTEPLTPTPTKGSDNMTYDPKKVIAIARAEVGYLEKASNSQLDDKTANAGSKNYTKYGRDLDALGFYNGRKNGVAWCDQFVDWSFVQAYGLDAALALTFQPLGKSNCGAGCKYSRNYYKNNGRLFDDPQPGDQIFFYSSDKSSISHTGLVYAVDKTYVYTVEGNTSSASGVVANGGCVREKKYKLSYERIAGYGRPPYGMEVVTDPAELRKGDEGAAVTALQTDLVFLGYNLGTYGAKKNGIDGDFGSKTETALKTFQKDYGLTVTGTYNADTRAMMEAALAGNNAAPTTPDTPEAGGDGKTYVVINTNAVNIRQGDSTDYGKVTQVGKDTKFEYVATSPTGWYAIRYKKMIAWVSNKYSEIKAG